jgi:hypothetical protein
MGWEKKKRAEKERDKEINLVMITLVIQKENFNGIWGPSYYN